MWLGIKIFMIKGPELLICKYNHHEIKPLSFEDLFYYLLVLIS